MRKLYALLSFFFLSLVLVGCDLFGNTTITIPSTTGEFTFTTTTTTEATTDSTSMTTTESTTASTPDTTVSTTQTTMTTQPVTTTATTVSVTTQPTTTVTTQPTTTTTTTEATTTTTVTTQPTTTTTTTETTTTTSATTQPTTTTTTTETTTTTTVTTQPTTTTTTTETTTTATTAQQFIDIAVILADEPTGSVKVKGVVYYVIATLDRPAYYLYDGTGHILVIDSNVVEVGDEVEFTAEFDTSEPAPQLINVSNFATYSEAIALPEYVVTDLSTIVSHAASDYAFHGAPVRITGVVGQEGPAFVLTNGTNKVILNNKAFVSGNPFLGLIGQTVTINAVVHFYDGMMSAWHVLYDPAYPVGGEVTVGEYANVYVALGVDVNWTDIVTRMGYTTGTISVDTDVLGTTPVMLDDKTVMVTVFDDLNIDFVLNLGSLIIMPSQSDWHGYEIPFDVPAKALVEVSVGDGLRATVEISEMGSYNTIAYIQNMGIESVTPVALGAGNYKLFVENLGAENQPLIIGLKLNSLIDDDSSHVLIDENQMLIVYDPHQNTQTINLDSQVQGNKEITLVAMGPFKVVLKNSSGQIIYSADSIQTYYQSVFELNQSLLVDVYELVIEWYDEVKPMNVFFYDQVHDNENYVYSDPLTLDNSNEIVVLPGRDWFYFDITTAGMYQVDILYATERIYDFAIYNSDAEEIYYAYEDVYLEPGRYYIYFLSITGLVDVKIISPVAQVTVNNDDASAINVSIGAYYEVYFDEDNTDKWYSFTLTEEKILDFLIAYNLNKYDSTLSLYNSSLEPIILDMDDFYYRLAAGSYYLVVSGQSEGETIFMIEEETVGEIVQSELSPYILGYGVSVSSYIHIDDMHYYQLNIPANTIVAFSYGGNSDAIVTTYSGGVEVEQFVVYNGDKTYIYFTAGTYELTLDLAHGNDIYQFRADPFMNQPPYAATIEASGYLTGGEHAQYYCLEGGEIVFAKFVVEEPSVLSAYFENADIVTVYDLAGNLIASGNTWSLFPIILNTGTYVIELESAFPGMLGYHNFNLQPMFEYASALGTSTTLDDLYSVRGVNFNGETVDVMTFVLTEDHYMYWTADGMGLEYQIFDMNFLPVTDAMTYSNRFWVPAGSYYLVINSEDVYYNVYIEMIDHLLVGDDFASATELYVSDEETPEYFLADKHLSGYYKFVINEPTYLHFEFDKNNYAIEVFDSNQDPYLAPEFLPGTYYIRIMYHQDIYDESISTINFKVDNVNGKVIDNTMATAFDLEANFYDGLIVDMNHEAWFKYVLEHDAIVDTYRWTSNVAVVFTLHDAAGLLIKTVTNEKLFLEAGTYYIKVEGGLAEYDIRINAYNYTAVGDTGVDAEVIVLDDTRSFSLDSGIKNGDDEDWFKLVLTEPTFYRLYMSNFSYGTLRIYDESMTYISQPSSSTYLNLDAGTYYFQVNMSQVGLYSLWFTQHDDWLLGVDFANAREIMLDSDYYMYFTEADMTKHFAFTITEPTNINPYKTGYSTDVVTVYAADQTTVITDYALEPGTYYVTYYRPYYTGYTSMTIYTVASLEPDPLDIDNTIETPVEVTGPTFTLKQSTTDYNSSDFFSVTLTEPMLYGIESVNWSSATIRVYDPADIYSPIYTFYYVDSDSNFYVEAGTYIIEVTQTWGLYEFNFIEFPYEDFSQDELNPTQLFIHKNLSSFLFGISDIDYFEFVLTDNHALVFESWADVYVNVYDESANLVGTSFDAFVILPMGTYRIVVVPQFDQVTQYDLNIYDVTNELLATDAGNANLIVVDTFSRMFSGYVEEDVPGYLTFTLTENAEVLIASGTPFEVLDSTMTPVTGTSSYMLLAGTYYIKLTSDYDYNINVSYQALTPLLHDSSVPIVLVPGTIQSGYSKDYSEVDVFTYAPTVDQYLYFDFLTYVYPTIEVKDSTDTVIMSGSMDSNTLKQRYFFVRAGETYTISLSGVYGRYNFVVRSVPFEDFGDEPLTAQTIASTEFDQTMTSLILDYLDDDWYVFEITEAVTVYITSTNSFIGLYASSDTATPLVTDSTQILLNPGTYYLEFSDVVNTSYSFTINTVS
ncbi:MAG: hypothetical protein JXR38_02295 [Bacilli bacterium]|nr:hypothetical protein [Bacilli bacterium]